MNTNLAALSPSPREAAGRVAARCDSNAQRGGGTAISNQKSIIRKSDVFLMTDYCFLFPDAAPPPIPPRHSQELVGGGEMRGCK
jgi:hypothetical protein